MLNKKPMILVIAGPNGSGKSTFTRYFETIGEYTNADDVVAATGMDNEEAARLVDKKRYDSITNKKDFTFETVLSSEYKMKILRKAKEEGYFIKCIFVLTVDPRVNVARVQSRVAQGGHDVERGKIISRYEKSLGHIKELLEICDILHVYDNTMNPFRIIRKHKEDISIFSNELWSEERILSLMQ
ncbi:MAG: zeta toxin family protein [Schwartzia sp.]|nr:zeta toxin family protein [Schwartzia sp. (in: firmicutes)]